jgi:hypothetical protein
VTLAVAGLLAFRVPVFVDTREYASAVYNVTKNPTIENGAVFARESIKYRRIALITHLAAIGIVFILITAGWSLLAQDRRNPRSIVTGLGDQDGR